MKFDSIKPMEVTMSSPIDNSINFVHQEKGKEKKVKLGFDKTAFFLTGIWAALNGLWKQTVAWVGYNFLILIVFGQMVRADWNGYIIFFVVAFLWLVYSYTYGELFTEWKIKKLKMKGFTTTNKIPDPQSKEVFKKVGIGYAAILIIIVLYLISIPTVFDIDYANELIRDKDYESMVDHFDDKEDTYINKEETAIINWLISNIDHVKSKEALSELAKNDAVKLELIENHPKAALKVVDKAFIKKTALDYAEKGMSDNFYLTVVSLDDKDLNVAVYEKYKKVFLGYDNPSLFPFSAFGKFISAVSRQYTESEDLFYRNIQKEYKEWNDYSDAYAVQDSINLIQRNIDKDFPGVYWCKEDFYIVQNLKSKGPGFVYETKTGYYKDQTTILMTPVAFNSKGMYYDNFWAWKDTDQIAESNFGTPMKVRTVTALYDYQADELKALRKERKRLKKKLTPEMKKVIARFEKK